MRALIVTVIMCLMLPSCGNARLAEYRIGYYDLFDTYISLTVYAASEEEYITIRGMVYGRLGELHKSFDAFNTYDGVNNIKTINDSAGIAPVAVNGDIMGLLGLADEAYRQTGGAVNIAIGPVTSVWRDYREAAYAGSAGAPDKTELLDAARHTDFNKIIIDKSNNTAYLAESGMLLDVGALAKGYAASVVINELKQAGHSDCLLDMGGNVAALGKPPGRNAWSVGVYNPAGDLDDDYLDIVSLADASVVTSGDYQRYYEFNGARYHHIIDPETLMPADRFKAVTVMHEDSGAADMLSTALFILPHEAGLELAYIYGAYVLWVTRDNEVLKTP